MFILFILNSPTISETCPNITIVPNIFIPFDSLDIRVAGRGNSNPSTISDAWLSVTYCSFEIGSTNEPTCTTGSPPSLSSNECYTRLDIQIAYAKIGAVANSQPIIGAVAFHFQTLVSQHVYLDELSYIYIHIHQILTFF